MSSLRPAADSRNGNNVGSAEFPVYCASGGSCAPLAPGTTADRRGTIGVKIARGLRSVQLENGSSSWTTTSAGLALRLPRIERGLTLSSRMLALFRRNRQERPVVSPSLRRFAGLLRPLQYGPFQRRGPPKRSGVIELVLPVIILSDFIGPKHTCRNASESIGNDNVFYFTIFRRKIVVADFSRIAGAKWP